MSKFCLQRRIESWTSFIHFNDRILQRSHWGIHSLVSRKMVESNLTYEECRRQRLEENKKRMEELNLNKLADAFKSSSPKSSPVCFCCFELLRKPMPSTMIMDLKLKLSLSVWVMEDETAKASSSNTRCLVLLCEKV